MNKKIHIVSFDVPYPANYGGVIDVYHRCKALTEIGVKVILHCFEYGRGEQQELLKVASEINYYKRRKNPFLLFRKNPFIVESRKSSELLLNLLTDDAPILFEGHHTCYYLNHGKLKNRKKLIRAHNIEHEYYRELAKSEPNLFKRLFFKIEAKKLKKFEHKQFGESQSTILTVSLKEQEYYKKQFKKSFYTPVFNPLNIGDYQFNKEKFFLIHGNMTVAENYQSAIHIAKSVFKDSNEQLIITGYNPMPILYEELGNLSNIQIIPSPSDKELNELISTASANILFTFQNTGIKHKLLNALSNGGFCIANNEMIDGTGLEELCLRANSKEEILNKLQYCQNNSFSIEEFQKRKSFLISHFDVKKNAMKILDLL